jgi:hypothetical protein
MGYHLEGDLLEVCDCKVLCPCWIGEDADNGTCDTILAYNMKSGAINGTDVKGLSLALMAHIPGNILKGNWSVAVFVDERATKEQEDALLGVWTGKFGGPVADLAKFVGQVVSVQRAPITFTLVEGRGILKIGTAADCEMAPFKGAGDRVTTLNDSVFSTIPGSPAYVAKATKYKRNSKSFGLPDVNLENHNAIQGTFLFDC